jgi:hypothetical protein
MKFHNKQFLYVGGGIFLVGAFALFFAYSPWVVSNNVRVQVTVNALLIALVTFLGVFLAEFLNRHRENVHARKLDRRSLKSSLSFLFSEIMNNYEILTDFQKQLNGNMPPSKAGVADFLAGILNELKNEVYISFIASRSIVFLNSDNLVNAIQHIYKTTSVTQFKWGMVGQLSKEVQMNTPEKAKRSQLFDPVFDHGVEVLAKSIKEYRVNIPIIVQSMKDLGLTYTLMSNTGDIDFMDDASLKAFLSK